MTYKRYKPEEKQKNNPTDGLLTTKAVFGTYKRNEEYSKHWICR